MSGPRLIVALALFACQGAKHERTAPAQSPEMNITVAEHTAPREPAPAPPPSPQAQALAQVIHAPVTILDASETDDGTFVVFRFNTLEAHLGALDPTQRELALAQMKSVREQCQAQREAARTGARDTWEPEQTDLWIPCEVLAAEALIPRPQRAAKQADPSSAPASALSPRCDALGIAIMTSAVAVAAHQVITEKSCLGRVEPLERRDFTGAGRPQIVLTATHEEWRTMAWGWSVDVETRTLTAFELAGGGLQEVLSMVLDEAVFLESTLRTTCRYTVDSPGVVTRYVDAWNSISGGLEVHRIRWDAKRKRWGPPTALQGHRGVIPEDALPLDRPAD